MAEGGVREALLGCLKWAEVIVRGISLRVSPSGHCASPQGFRAGATACGVRSGGSLDLALLASERDAAVAGTFTQNQFAAAPVHLDRRTIAGNPGHMRAVIANSGNANACTGEQGERDAAKMQEETARALGLRGEQVLVLSTGVIGVAMPMACIVGGIERLPEVVSRQGGADAARAIMTTDTVPKHGSVELELESGTVRIGGVAKGSGMIHPNMATMLAVLTTDALVGHEALQRALGAAVGRSFNAISVDGDTSTNDTVLLLANGASGVSVGSAASEEAFQHALNLLCVDLAKKIVRDGEGATRFVEVQVVGSADDLAARAVAATIATSPLVKTAFAGGDPNWGRILAAAGRAGVAVEPSKVSLEIGSLAEPSDVVLVRNGTPTDYAEAEAAAVFAQPEFGVRLRLGAGPGRATVWTTDLTHEYVRINADYRS